MTNEPFFDWTWVADNGDLIGERLLEHLLLTGLAVGIGLLISLPLAVLAFRQHLLYGPITWTTGTLYAIPSLALFSLLVPFTGLTKVTAEIGLVSYTLLILIRNIVAGLAGVPDDVKESALGMGFSRRRLLWGIELPLSLPVILAGVRIATVTTIGLVTVTAFVGEGGLGYFILTGFRRAPRITQVMVGLVLSMALAIAFDGLWLAAQRLLTPWQRRRAERAA